MGGSSEIQSSGLEMGTWPKHTASLRSPHDAASGAVAVIVPSHMYCHRKQGEGLWVVSGSRGLHVHQNEECVRSELEEVTREQVLGGPE